MLVAVLAWALVVAKAFENIPIEDYQPICQNDGWYRGESEGCSCKPYFYGTTCANRRCMNGGHNYDDDVTNRCVCPPGFIGAHCEPRECTGDGTTLRTFNPPDNTGRSVSYILSWSEDIANKTKGSNGDDDDFMSTVCNVFDKGNIKEVFLYVAPVTGGRFESKADCVKFVDSTIRAVLCGPPDPDYPDEPGFCELDSMNPAYIQKAVAESFPNSPVFIIANAKLPISKDQMATIVQLANSLGVTVNTLLFSPEGVNYIEVYDSADFAGYRELADRTGGFYLTPYDTRQRLLLGNDGISDSLFNVFDLLTTTKPIYIDPTPDLLYLYSEDKTIYFSFQANGSNVFPKGQLPDFSFQLLNPGPPKYVEGDLTEYDTTGFTNIYKYTFPDAADKVITGIMQVKSNGAPLKGLRIYGKPSFPLGVAVSTADVVDASHPHAVPIANKYAPNGPTLLVSAGEGISLTRAYSNDWSITVNNGDSARKSDTKCQYGSVLGSIESCVDKTTNWLLLTQTNTQSTGVFPLYCGNALYESSNPPPGFGRKEIVTAEVRPIEQPSGCFQPPGSSPSKYIRSGDSVGFGLIIEDNKGITDPLLTNPGNIFEKLVPLWNSKAMYGVTTVAQAGGVLMSAASSDLGSVMGNLKNYLNDTKPKAINYLDVFNRAYTTTLSNSAYVYFDLFVVASAANPFNLDDDPAESNTEYNILQWLYQRRIRLHWFWVNNPGARDNAWTRRVCSATGGISHSFDTPEEVARFIDSSNFLYGHELVYSQEVQMNMVFSDWFQMIAGEKVYFVLEGNSTDDRDVGVLGNSLTRTYQSSDRMLDVYEYVSSNDATTYFQIHYIAQNGFSVRVYSERAIKYSMAFASGNKLTSDGDMYGPIYGQPIQFPLFANVNQTATFNIYQQPNNSVIFNPLDLTGEMTDNTCSPASGFSYYFSYNWVCQVPRQLYQLKVETNEATRMFSFVCNTDLSKPHQACGAHADPYKDTCVCRPGWTGSDCNSPVCLSGGTALSGGTCNCVTGFEGFFCEYDTSLTCKPTGAFPAYRSMIGSLIFVFEESKAVADQISSWISDIQGMSRTTLTNTFQAAQIIIVTHSDGKVTARLASNDPRLIGSSFLDLITWSDDQKGDKSEDGLIAGLQLQTTDRSLLVWVTSSVYDAPGPITDPQKILLKMIPEKRADVRIYTVGAQEAGKDSLINRLSIASAAVPIKLQSEDSFKKIFSSYHAQALPRSNQFGPILNTNGFATDCKMDDYPFELYISKTTTMVFITVQGLKIVQPAGDVVVEIEPNTLYSIDVTAQNLAGKPLTFQFERLLGADACAYSIETLSQDQVAFGLATDLESQVALSTSMLINGSTNFMNILWSGIDVPGYTNPETSQIVDAFQNVQQWPVYSENEYYTIDWTKSGQNILARTHNLSDPQCTYPYMPQMLPCDASTNGYLTRIFTTSLTTRQVLQKYVYLPCLPDDPSTFCQNGGTFLADERVCDCGNHWNGLDCTVPKCENGGTLNGRVCNCPKGSYGVACEFDDTTSRDPRKRALLFIFDRYLPGGVDTDLDIMREAINTTINLYRLTQDAQNVTIFMADTEAGELIVPHTPFQVNVQLGLWVVTNRDRLRVSMAVLAGNLDLGSAKYDYTNAFFVTKRTGINPADATEPMRMLRDDQGFSFLSIGFGVDVSNLSPWGDTLTVNSVSEFVDAAIDFNGGSDYPYTTGSPPTVSSTNEPTTTVTGIASTTMETSPGSTITGSTVAPPSTISGQTQPSTNTPQSTTPGPSVITESPATGETSPPISTSIAPPHSSTPSTQSPVTSAGTEATPGTTPGSESTVAGGSSTLNTESSTSNTPTTTPTTTTRTTTTTTRIPPTTTEYGLCTMNARADVVFMVDGTMSPDTRDLVVAVLTNYYAQVSTSPQQKMDFNDFCDKCEQWTGFWNTRVAVVNYQRKGFKGTNPLMCTDSFNMSIQTTQTIGDSSPLEMDGIVNVQSKWWEGSCRCRRWANTTNPVGYPGGIGIAACPEQAAQLMFWMPSTYNYTGTVPFISGQLYSFKHYLVPTAGLTAANAPDDTIWTQMTDLPYVTPDKQKDRQTVVEALWKVLCEQANTTTSHIPRAPDFWEVPVFETEAGDEEDPEGNAEEHDAQTANRMIPPDSEDELCTMNAKADVVFMVDGTMSAETRDLVVAVLSNYYANLSTSPKLALSPGDFCDSCDEWKGNWNTRVAIVNYVRKGYKGVNPVMCSDSFNLSLQTTMSISDTNPIEMERIVGIQSKWWEESCRCRRWSNNTNPLGRPAGMGIADCPDQAAQLMFWMPARYNYEGTVPFISEQLYSFQHYLVPTAGLTAANAPDGTIWKQMTDLPHVPTDKQTDRQTVVEALWRILCEKAKVITGNVPRAPQYWEVPVFEAEADQEENQEVKDQQDQGTKKKSILDLNLPKTKPSTFGFSFLGIEF